MSENGSGQSPGRRPGPTPETMAKARWFRELRSFGVTVDAIAEREGVARSEVYRMLQCLKPMLVPDQQGPVQRPKPPPAPRKKISEGTLLRRAFAAIRNVRAFKGLLNAETREFWVEALIEIRALAEDGVTLTFGQPGDVYQTQDEFLGVFEGITPTNLQTLFRHAMLIDLDGQGIALPHRWELRPKPPRQAEAPSGQWSMQPYSVIQGGLSAGSIDPDSGAIYPDSQGIYPDIDPDIDPDSRGIDPDINPDSRTAAAAAAASLNLELKERLSSSSSTLVLPARESGSIAAESGSMSGSMSGSIAPESGSNPPAKPRLHPSAEAAAELMALVQTGRSPTAKDVGTVQSWLHAGDTLETMRAVIQARLLVHEGGPIASLRYFEGCMTEARHARRHQPAPAAPQDAPAVPQEPEPVPPTGPGIEDQWGRVQCRMRKSIGAQPYRTWLRYVALDGIEGDTVTVRLPTRFLRDYIRQHYEAGLLRDWQAENAAIRRIEIGVAPPA